MYSHRRRKRGMRVGGQRPQAGGGHVPLIICQGTWWKCARNNLPGVSVHPNYSVLSPQYHTTKYTKNAIWHEKFRKVFGGIIFQGRRYCLSTSCRTHTQPRHTSVWFAAACLPVWTEIAADVYRPNSRQQLTDCQVICCCDLCTVS